MTTQHDKARIFEHLHRKGNCFLIPNPWDAGAARLLEHLGCVALASTGAGYAFSQGKPDLAVNAQAMLPHLTQLCQASQLPVSADLQNGFGAAPEAAAAAVRAAAQTGIVGCSIEDATGERARPIDDLGSAKARIECAVAAARELDFKLMLTARADNYFYGITDLADTIERLQAYQEAGADVLFAPGLRTKAEIETVLRAIDRPLNVLMGMAGEQLTMDELCELGVTRISLGGSLARTAYSAMVRAIQDIHQHGRFTFAQDSLSGRELNRIFG